MDCCGSRITETSVDLLMVEIRALKVWQCYSTACLVTEWASSSLKTFTICLHVFSFGPSEGRKSREQLTNPGSPRQCQYVADSQISIICNAFCRTIYNYILAFINQSIKNFSTTGDLSNFTKTTSLPFHMPLTIFVYYFE